MSVVRRAAPRLEDEIATLLSMRRSRHGPLATPPRLARAIEIIAAHLPATEAAVQERLIRARLVRGPIALGEIERAARHCDPGLSFAVLRRAGLVIAVPASRHGLALRIHRLAVLAMVSAGLGRVHAIAFRAGTDDATFAAAVLSAKDDFEWLDRAGGWFWFAGQGGTAVERVERILRVVRHVSIDELQAAVFRRQGPEGTPSARALQAICDRSPRLRVTRGFVRLAADGSQRPPLSDSERALVAVLRATGSAPDGQGLPELAAALGMRSAALARTLRRSPLVTEPRPGFFRLLGGSDGGPGAPGGGAPGLQDTAKSA